MNFSVEYSVTERGRKVPSYRLDTDLNGEVSLLELLEFTKQSLIVIADQTLREEQANGFDKDPVVIVDGRVNKPVIAVNPLGKIEFVSRRNMDEILLATMKGIIERSRVVTGQYIRSHRVFLNGKQVADDLPSLERWLATSPELADKDLFRFVNIAPYARKLERLGVTAQRSNTRSVKSRDKKQRSGTHILAANGAYFLTARSIRRLFKRNSTIAFSFISGMSLGISAGFKAAGVRKSPRPYLYPSILVSVKESGIL